MTLTVLLIGFAGLGTQDHQTAMYLPAFAAHPGFRITGVAATEDSDTERAKQAALELSVPYFDDVDSALSTSESDVACVATSAEQGARVLATVVRAGWHVLADKPLASTLAEAESLAEEAKRAGVVALVAHHHRFHPMLTAAASAVRAGRVGLPWNVQADFIVAGGTPCPDGELLNLGGHPLDVVSALTGLEVHRVHALSAGNSTMLMLDHDHGMTSTIAVGRTGPVAGVPDGRLVQHRYRISGSHGVMLIDATKPALTVATAQSVRKSWLPIDTVTGLLDELYAAVTARRSSPVGMAEAVTSLRIIEAAQRSLVDGVPVEIGA